MSEDQNFVPVMLQSIGADVISNVITSAPKWLPKSLLLRSRAEETAVKDAFQRSLYRAYLDTVEKYSDASRYGFNEEMLESAEPVLQTVFDPQNYRDPTSLSQELIKVWSDSRKAQFPTYDPEQARDTQQLMSDAAPDFLDFLYKSLQEREVFTSFFTNQHQMFTEEYHRKELAELKKLDERLREQGSTQEAAAQQLYKLVVDIYIEIQNLRYLIGRPLDLEHFTFDNEFERYFHNFVERPELEGDLAKHRNSYDRGYFCVMAAAGLGKSAFAANLAVKLNAPIFFFNEAEGRTDPATCWTHLTADLVTRFDLDPKALPQRASIGDPALFSESLHQAVTKSEGPVWIVIDAVDEADAPAPGRNIINLPSSLPKGVYIVLTYRPGVPRPDVTTTPFQTHLIDPQDKEQGNTITAYLEKVSNLPAIEELLEAATPPITKSSFVRKLKQASENNFMYVRYVVDDLSARTPDSFSTLIRSTLDALPNGLIGYYNRFWSHFKETDDEVWETVNQPLLGLLSAAREPVSSDWLAKLSGLQKTRVNRVLERWQRFLSPQNNGDETLWRVIHQSFNDFLKEKDVAFEAHEKIIQHYLTSWGSLPDGLPSLLSTNWAEDFNRYGITYIVSHFAEVRDTERIYSLLSLEQSGQPSGGISVSSYNVWYRAHSVASLLDKFLNDVQQAWREFERQSVKDIAEGRPAATLGREAFSALLTVSIRTAFSRVPSALLPHLLEHKIITSREAFFQALNNRGDDQGSYELLRLAHVADEALLQLVLGRIEEDVQKHGGMLGPLAPSIPLSLFGTATAIAHKIDDPLTQGTVYLSLQEHAPQDNKTQFVALAKEVYTKIVTPQAKVDLLKHFQDHLEPEETEELALQAFAQVREADAMDRIGPLTGLIPLLPRGEKELALELALESAKTNKCYGDKIVEESDGIDHIIYNGDYIIDNGYLWPLRQLIGEFVQHRLDLILDEVRSTQNSLLTSEIVEALPYSRKLEILKEVSEVDVSSAYLTSQLGSSPEARAKGFELASRGPEGDKLSYLYNLSGRLSAKEVEQVVTLVESITKPSDQCKALVHLLKLADGDGRKTISSVLDACLSRISEEHIVLNFLRETLPYRERIPKQAFMAALRGAVTAYAKTSVYEKLAVEAFHLDETLSPKELEDVFVFEFAYEDALQRPSYQNPRCQLAEALAPQFTEDQFEALLLTASVRAESPSQSFDIIERLVKARRKPMRASLQKVAMDAALASEAYINSNAVSKLVESWVGPLDPYVLRSAFEASRAIADQEVTAKALTEFAPFVSKNLLDEVVAFVRQYGGALQLARVAMSCDGQKKLELVGEAIEKGIYNKHSYYSETDPDFKIFELLPPHFSENLLPTVLRKLQTLKGEFWENLALSFVRSLPKPLSQSVLQLADTTEDYGIRASLFAEILPNLEEATQLQLANSLIASEELIADISDQCKFVPRLLAVCEEPKRQRIMDLVLETVNAQVGDDSSGYLAKRVIASLQPLVENLPAIVPTLCRLAESIREPSERYKTLVEVLQPVDIKGAKEALSYALDEENSTWGPSIVLRDLAPILRGELAEFALEKARSFSADSSIKAQTLIQLAKVTKVSSEEIAAAVRQGHEPFLYIEASTVLNDSYSVQLMAEGLELFKRRLENEREHQFQDEFRRELTITINEAAPQLSGDALTHLVHSIPNLTQFNVPGIVRAIAPKLEREHLTYLLHWSDGSPDIVYELAPHLDRENVLTTQDLLRAARMGFFYQASTEQNRTSVELMLRRPLSEIHQLWSKVVQGNSARVGYTVDFHSRSSFLSVLAAFAPVINLLGGETAASEAAKAILQVSRWWAPMK